MPSTSDLIPTHLDGFATAIQTDGGATRSLQLRSAQGGEWFELRFHGELLDGSTLVVEGEEQPALVVARAVDTGEEVVVFDGGRHGYEAMFVEAFDADELDARELEQAWRSPEGAERVRIRVELFDNIDWDEEQEEVLDEDGRIVLVDGTVIDEQRLRADGFDAIGVIAIDEDGGEHPVVEEELA